jgi:hypothetical protein
MTILQINDAILPIGGSNPYYNGITLVSGAIPATATIGGVANTPIPLDDITFQFAFDKTSYFGKVSKDGNFITNIVNGTGKPGLEPSLVALMKTTDEGFPLFPPIVFNCDELSCLRSKEFNEMRWRFVIGLVIIYMLFVNRP